jgi:hypothetical protein
MPCEAPIDLDDNIRLVSHCLKRAVRHCPWAGVCLSQSIAAFVMFRRRGIPAVIFVGVKFFEESSLLAHAWVQAGAETSSEDDATYTPLMTIG